MRPAPTLLACALAGVLHALSFAPWNQPALQVAALGLLVGLSSRLKTPRAAAAAGFAFGLGWFLTGISWVYISMHTYGGMPAWIAGAATAAMAACLALYPALAAGSAHALSRAPGARLLLAWPAAWTVSEWLRATVLTGFPWLASGYAHADGPLSGYAPLAGVYGVSFAAALVAATLAWLLVYSRTSFGRAAALAAVAALLGAGQLARHKQWTAPSGPALTVDLVQGNVPQDLKFAEDGLRLSIERYLSLLESPQARHADLIALPESAFPVPLEDLPSELRERLQEVARPAGRALIFGVFIEQPAGHFFNSAIGLQGDAPAQRYSKRHLVPFGEFIPYGFRWFVDLMNMPIGDQDHGGSRQPPMQIAGQRIAVNICFEDLFGREIISAWDDPGGEPTLLLNLSNLAWFGDSSALPQHLQISRMRALETGRPLLRATNTGATALIDAQGRVQAELAFRTTRSLVVSVQGHIGRTPYVRWGDIPALSLAVLLLAGALGLRLRLRPARSEPT